jgi:hypothetical protein
MPVTAIMLRRIDGPEGRKLYGGKPPAVAVSRTLALAARLGREAGRWEAELREAGNATRRVQAARLGNGRGKGMARVAA